jgi:hypothetical protein
VTSFLLSEATGWVIAVLVPMTIAIPYAVRGRRLAPEGWGIGYLQRMVPHYWIGYTIAGASVVHVGFAMAGPLPAGGAYQAGLWIATGGALLVFGQVLLGVRLRERRGPGRLRLRRAHFAVMAGLVSAGALHLLLNGAVLQSLLSALPLGGLRPG